MNKSTEPTPAAMQVMSEPAKLIPKLVTKIGAAKAGSAYILSFISELTGESAQMIDRVAIDEKTVESLIELLNNLKEANKDDE